MEDKSLADKAIDIKGKQYVLVQDRVVYFNQNYPKGSITTELISAPESKYIVVKARVSPDDGPRIFTGYSQATIGDGYINKTSALENAETSAVGRALAFMGIGVIESIASADEMVKATTAQKTATGRTETSEVANREKARKDRILANLKRMGKSVKTKEEIAQAVFDLVGMELVPEKYDEIGEALGRLK